MAEWRRPTDEQRRQIDELLELRAAECAPDIRLTWEWRDEQRDLRITGTRTEGATDLSFGTGAYQGEIALEADPIAFVDALAKKAIEGSRR